MNVRTYGGAPFRVAVVHGGPGGAGSMAEVAAELSRSFGVLEPLQAATTVAGQIDELGRSLQEYAMAPVALICHSWGAWLGLMLAARRPALVRSLVLVSCGVLEERFTVQLQERRLARLTPAERHTFRAALAKLEEGTDQVDERAFRDLEELSEKADSYELLPVSRKRAVEAGQSAAQARIYSSVWPEAAEMRRSGELLQLASTVRCPVLAIHGDSDPSPAEGVSGPLSRAIPEVRFILLKQSGHTPWRERYAREEFLRLVRAEVEAQGG